MLVLTCYLAIEQDISTGSVNKSEEQQEVFQLPERKKAGG